MNEPGTFFEGTSLRITTCETCKSTRPLWASIEKLEWQRLYSKALVCAGWLLVANRWHCDQCATMLRARLMTMPTGEKLAVQNALADALFATRISVSNA